MCVCVLLLLLKKINNNLDKFLLSTNLTTLFVCACSSFFIYFLDKFSLSTNQATLLCGRIVVVVVKKILTID